jgi:hypothetical protein
MNFELINITSDEKGRFSERIVHPFCPLCFNWSVKYLVEDDCCSNKVCLTLISALNLPMSKLFFRHKEDFSPEQVKTLEEMFKQNLPHNKTELTLQEFKKIMPSKNVSLKFVRF